MSKLSSTAHDKLKSKNLTSFSKTTSLSHVRISSADDNSTTTPRIEIKLFETTEKTYPEINIQDILKDYTTQTSTADTLDDVKSIAARFEKKYGKASAFNRKKKGKQNIQDYLDAGEGYDKDDSFVDDTETYDENLPAWLDTQHRGFYINCGKLKLVKRALEEKIDVEDDIKRRGKFDPDDKKSISKLSNQNSDTAKTTTTNGKYPRLGDTSSEDELPLSALVQKKYKPNVDKSKPEEKILEKKSPDPPPKPALSNKMTVLVGNLKNAIEAEMALHLETYSKHDPNIVRRTFLWSDRSKVALNAVVTERITAELPPQTKGLGNDALSLWLKNWLEIQIKPLWPKGWMQARVLMKHSREIHQSLTGFTTTESTPRLPKTEKKPMPVKRPSQSKPPNLTSKPDVQEPVKATEIVSITAKDVKPSNTTTPEPTSSPGSKPNFVLKPEQDGRVIIYVDNKELSQDDFLKKVENGKIDMDQLQNIVEQLSSPVFQKTHKKTLTNGGSSKQDSLRVTPSPVIQPSAVIDLTGHDEVKTARSVRQQFIQKKADEYNSQKTIEADGNPEKRARMSVGNFTNFNIIDPKMILGTTSNSIGNILQGTTISSPMQFNNIPTGTSTMNLFTSNTNLTKLPTLQPTMLCQQASTPPRTISNFISNPSPQLLSFPIITQPSDTSVTNKNMHSLPLPTLSLDQFLQFPKKFNP